MLSMMTWVGGWVGGAVGGPRHTHAATTLHLLCFVKARQGAGGTRRSGTQNGSLGTSTTACRTNLSPPSYVYPCALTHTHTHTHLPRFPPPAHPDVSVVQVFAPGAQQAQLGIVPASRRSAGRARGGVTGHRQQRQKLLCGKQAGRSAGQSAASRSPTALLGGLLRGHALRVCGARTAWRGRPPHGAARLGSGGRWRRGVAAPPPAPGRRSLW